MQNLVLYRNVACELIARLQAAVHDFRRAIPHTVLSSGSWLEMGIPGAAPALRSFPHQPLKAHHSLSHRLLCHTRGAAPRDMADMCIAQLPGFFAGKSHIAMRKAAFRACDISMR